MFYDLHIHSALSPCSLDDMTINNIVNMAYIKNLDIISICDHNSVKQLEHLAKIAHNKIDFVYGVEMQTREEVHVLAYFLPDTNLKTIQQFLDRYLIEEPNDSYYFGHQYIFDKEDHIIDEEPRLLIKSLDLLLKETIDYIHELGGIAVLAHVMSERFSVMNIYFKIDKDWDFDGIEVKNDEQKNIMIEKYPFLNDTMWFMNSDAHQLEQINEPIHEIDKIEFYNLWRKRYG